MIIVAFTCMYIINQRGMSVANKLCKIHLFLYLQDKILNTGKVKIQELSKYYMKKNHQSKFY